MENRRRYLSLFLAVLLCLSLLPMGVLASDDLPEEKSIEFFEEVEDIEEPIAEEVSDYFETEASEPVSESAPGEAFETACEEEIIAELDEIEAYEESADRMVDAAAESYESPVENEEYELWMDGGTSRPASTPYIRTLVRLLTALLIGE